MNYTDTLTKVTIMVNSEKYGLEMSKALTSGTTVKINIPSDAGKWTCKAGSAGGSGYTTIYVRD